MTVELRAQVLVISPSLVGFQLEVMVLICV